MTCLTLYIAALLPTAPPELSEDLRKSGIAVTVRVTDAETGSVGSGVVVGIKDGLVYVLTAAHLINKDSRPGIEGFSLEKKPKAAAGLEKGDVVYLAEDSDLAILRYAAGKTKWTAAQIAPPMKLDNLPDKPWVVGCDLGGEPRLTAVSVTGKKLVRRRSDDLRAFYWEAKGSSVSGRSGGPLFDHEKRVVGICSGTQEGMSYYCHLEEICKAIKNAKLEFILENKDKR